MPTVSLMGWLYLKCCRQAPSFINSWACGETPISSTEYFMELGAWVVVVLLTNFDSRRPYALVECLWGHRDGDL